MQLVFISHLLVFTKANLFPPWRLQTQNAAIWLSVMFLHPTLQLVKVHSKSNADDWTRPRYTLFWSRIKTTFCQFLACWSTMSPWELVWLPRWYVIRAAFSSQLFVKIELNRPYFPYASDSHRVSPSNMQHLTFSSPLALKRWWSRTSDPWLTEPERELKLALVGARNKMYIGWGLWRNSEEEWDISKRRLSSLYMVLFGKRWIYIEWRGWA